MVEIKTIHVLNASLLPKEYHYKLRRDYRQYSYVEFSLSDKDEDEFNKLEKYISETYKELNKVNYFLIHIDV